MLLIRLLLPLLLRLLLPCPVPLLLLCLLPLLLPFLLLLLLRVRASIRPFVQTYADYENNLYDENEYWLYM
jgi:hypothetical protein